MSSRYFIMDLCFWWRGHILNVCLRIRGDCHSWPGRLIQRSLTIGHAGFGTLCSRRLPVEKKSNNQSNLSNRIRMNWLRMMKKNLELVILRYKLVKFCFLIIYAYEYNKSLLQFQKSTILMKNIRQKQDILCWEVDIFDQKDIDLSSETRVTNFIILLECLLWISK